MSVKKINDSYIEVDGEVYEKITNPNCKNVDFDLDTETVKLIDDEMKRGYYVNQQDVVRSALRELVKQKTNSEDKYFDGKKLLND